LILDIGVLSERRSPRPGLDGWCRVGM